MIAHPALVVSHLTHRYGSRVALDDVSLSVAPGTFVALLGPNGGGKSTLFRICATLQRASEGSVLVFGSDVRTDAAAVRRRLGVVFQSPALDQRLTVRENLLHHGRLYGLQGRPLRAGIEEALARVGLTDRAREIVSRLSGGLKRRAEIAKVLMTRPSLLLLDEPTTGWTLACDATCGATWRRFAPATARPSCSPRTCSTRPPPPITSSAGPRPARRRWRSGHVDADGGRRRDSPADGSPGRSGGADHRAVSGRRLGGR